MSYSLIVIDMQEDFNAANGDVVRQNVLREIKAAIENNAGIIFLEYNDYCQTHNELLTPIVETNYKKFRSFIKYDDDGSEEVLKQITQRGWRKNRLKVCGVNTEYCVASTVRGLSSKLNLTSIEIIEDACASEFNHSQGIDKLKNTPKVIIK